MNTAEAVTNSALLPRTGKVVAPRCSIAAGIVVFQPDHAQLGWLVDTLLPEVDQVVLFLNSPLDLALNARLEQAPKVVVIRAEANLGIGVALNAIARTADEAGFDALVFFDQDSRPTPGMVTRLAAADAALGATGETPAVVGPRMVAPAGTDSKAPTYRLLPGTAQDGRVRAVLFVPTSGSLIRLDALRRVGEFRADYFIDGIDLEWNFRAWARGRSCWVALDCPMEHTVGSGVIAWPLLKFRMPKQRPFRMYCAIRNTLYGLRLRHVPLSWKVKQVTYLPIQMLAYALHYRFAPHVLAALMAGVGDGLRGRLGVPRGLPASNFR